jgi:hypothetical protein
VLWTWLTMMMEHVMPPLNHKDLYSVYHN